MGISKKSITLWDRTALGWIHNTFGQIRNTLGRIRNTSGSICGARTWLYSKAQPAPGWIVRRKCGGGPHRPEYQTSVSDLDTVGYLDISGNMFLQSVADPSQSVADLHTGIEKSKFLTLRVIPPAHPGRALVPKCSKIVPTWHPKWSQHGTQKPPKSKPNGVGRRPDGG